MKVTLRTESLVGFLRKCLLNKLTKDLILIAKGTEICARLADPSHTFYFEVVESGVKVAEEGFITIANLEKVIACINRINGDVVVIKSNENEFLITDGTKPIKFMQIAEELIESYIKRKLFDRAKFEYYEEGNIFTHGFEVEYDQLSELCGDAKAFGIESYNFFYKDNDCYCKIEDRQLNEQIKVKLRIIKWFTDTKIYNISVGVGFREIVAVLNKEKNKDNKNIIQIYTQPQSILITSATRKFFYCLNCI
jgi:hypothetical protein